MVAKFPAGHHKNPELATKLEHSTQWNELSINHLEGRTAAFFCYGDGGGDELDNVGRPNILRNKEYFDPTAEPFRDMRDTYAPLVWQCRYGGVEVPDSLWRYKESGNGKKYSDNQAEHMAKDETFLQGFDQWVDSFATFVKEKGKIQPGKYRAYGYVPPSHKWADLKLAWRDRMMRIGHAPSDSSPRKQHDMHLNRDATMSPRQGEGIKLRDS